MIGGIRTPISKAPVVNPPSKSPQKPMGEAGPSSQHSVRRSVGEWEAGLGEQLKPLSPPRTVTKEPKSKSKSPVPTKGTSVVVLIDSPPGPTNSAWNPRVAEARRCLNKVKQQMALSKNIKREIKEDVQVQVTRLFALIKEAEADHGRGPPAKACKQASETRMSATLPSSSPCSARGVEERRDAEFGTESLRKMLEEHKEKLAENSQMMDRLKEALRFSQENIEKISYANAAASQSERPPPRQTALHSIAVTTEDETTTGDGVLEKIREAVNAKEEWIKVDRVRKTKNRKVIMSFERKEDRDKVTDRLKKKGTDLTVEKVRNKNPLLILRGVLLVNTDEDVLRALKNQNGDVFHGLDGERAKVEIKYRKRARNPHTGHIVLSVSPIIWQRVTAKGHVHIDLQRIKAEDQTPLIQCTRCLGFGHTKKYCEDSVDVCSHCGGPHLRSECADWLAGEPAVCRNCKKINSAQAEHNAFSTECPQRRKWDDLARATVAYC